MLNECNGCEYQCKLSHIDICTLGSPCPHQRSTPMTNEEWLRTCSTEELAEFIRQQRDDWSDGWYSDCHRFDEILEWLKEKHDDK